MVSSTYYYIDNSAKINRDVYVLEYFARGSLSTSVRSRGVTAANTSEWFNQIV